MSDKQRIVRLKWYGPEDKPLEPFSITGRTEAGARYKIVLRDMDYHRCIYLIRALALRAARLIREERDRQRNAESSATRWVREITDAVNDRPKVEV